MPTIHYLFNMKGETSTAIEEVKNNQDLYVILTANNIDYSGYTPSGIPTVSPTESPYINNYFTIVALEDNSTIKVNPNISISLDDGSTWELSTGEDINVNNGDKILCKYNFDIENARLNVDFSLKRLLNISSGSGSGSGSGSDDDSNSSFTGSDILKTENNFAIEGNIMSLLYGDNFINQIDLTEMNYILSSLFYGQSHLINASNLVLPATTLATHCYYNMFCGCTSLTSAPELPATTLTGSCYFQMFDGCTSLTSAPELPATTLANDCYYQMFAGCTSLISTPELPATTLASGCYGYMFHSCTSLTSAPELPATTLANGCYSGMFSGCTSLTSAPELPATTLVDQCYNQMFDSCTSLNYIKCLATNISAYYCLANWVNKVSSAGTFVKNAFISSWPRGTSGIPTSWTVQNAS